MNPFARDNRYQAALLGLAFAFGQAGCASRPAAQPEAPLPPAGPPKIAVLANGKAPTIELYLPRESTRIRDNRTLIGMSEGAQTGATVANRIGLIAWLATLPVTGAAGVLLLWPLDAATKMVGGAVGAVAGGTVAAASGKLPEERKVERASPPPQPAFNKALAHAVAEAGRSWAANVAVLDNFPIGEGKPASGHPEANGNIDAARANGYTGLLEVGVTRIGLEAFVSPRRFGGDYPYVVLFVVGKGRLTDLPTGRSVVREYAYRVSARYVNGQVPADWLEEQLADARATLGERIAEDLLLEPVMGTEAPRDGACGIAPVAPGGIATQRIWEPFDAIYLATPTLASVRPSLAWKAFALPSGANPEDAVYDLRLWRVRIGDTPVLAYERRDLRMPAHAVEEDLARGETYQWEVRARFKLEGRPRATVWNRAAPVGVSAKDLPSTRFAGTQRPSCEAYYLPERSRFRFATAQPEVTPLPAVSPTPESPYDPSTLVSPETIGNVPAAKRMLAP